MTRDILLVHKDPEFISNFQEKYTKNGTRVISALSTKHLSDQMDLSKSVIVIDAQKDWKEAIEALKKTGRPFYAIVSETSLLKKTMAQIDSTSEQLCRNSEPLPQNRRKTDRPGGVLNFTEILEERLEGFVKKIKASEGKNLYNLLIQEVEKPLLKLALDETQGNQVKASELLGMHRNTLRKKMRELKIPSVKETKRKSLN